LRGKEISPADRPSFANQTHFSRVIGIYSQAADATVAWQCPDCGHEWARTGEPSFGLRTYELVSRFFVDSGLAGVEQPPEGIADGDALAEHPTRKKWRQFWK
jgi:hypothetical protein